MSSPLRVHCLRIRGVQKRSIRVSKIPVVADKIDMYIYIWLPGFQTDIVRLQNDYLRGITVRVKIGIGVHNWENWYHTIQNNDNRPCFR